MTEGDERMSQKLRFSILDYNTDEKVVLEIIDAPEPITASDILQYFIRFCIAAGYQMGSVDDVIVEYAQNVTYSGMIDVPEDDNSEE
jgi:hypothetical protein